MKNIETSVNGNILVVTIDLSKRFGLSSTGKSTIIASTEGNQAVVPGISMGINVYTKEGGKK
uniref:Uncharacterized protein n=1 Tax=viral metagenome TaxID=1070528 RepID=A0A6M3LD54_9ZZZZ